MDMDTRDMDMDSDSNSANKEQDIALTDAEKKEIEATTKKLREK